MNNDNFDLVVENYEPFFNDIKNELISGLEEGIKEGIKEGVKSGILNALSECSSLGFLKIKKTEIKEIDQILKDVVAETVEEKAEKITKEEICPIMKKNLKNICDEAVNIVKRQDFTLDNRIIEAGKKINIQKMAEEKIEEFKNYVEKKLPKNFIFKALLKGIQKGSYDCLNEDIKICERKINDVIKSKTSN